MPVCEQTWLSCDDPTRMLAHLGDRRSPRKLRLLAGACCRRAWHLLADGRLRAAVEASERFADGEVTDDELDRARAGARKATQTSPQPSAQRYVGSAVLTAVAREPVRLRWAPNDLLVAVSRSAAWHRYQPGRPQPSEPAAAEREKGPFCDLVRDLFGNPFRPATLDASWRTPDAVSLARAAYQERSLPAGTLEPARLALLADALEEAGCTSQEVLGHLRGPGPHVRGCWAVDLLLGKV